MEAVIATFFECFRFIIKNNLEKPDFCSCLIKSHVSAKLINLIIYIAMLVQIYRFSFQLVHLLQTILSDNSMSGISSSIFLHLSNLLRHWHKMVTSSTTYQSLLEEMWTSIHESMSSSVSKVTASTSETDTSSISKDELEKKLRVHQKLINALKNPVDIRPKKQTRVRNFFLLLKIKCLDDLIYRINVLCISRQNLLI